MKKNHNKKDCLFTQQCHVNAAHNLERRLSKRTALVTPGSTYLFTLQSRSRFHVKAEHTYTDSGSKGQMNNSWSGAPPGMFYDVIDHERNCLTASSPALRGINTRFIPAVNYTAPPIFTALGWLSDVHGLNWVYVH